MTKPLIVRPARLEDIPGLCRLAEEAGAGMTTVPQGEAAIGARVEASLKAFAGQGRATAQDSFFFVLDDGDGPQGMSCIFPDLGGDRPFYSYRISHLASQAPELNLRASTDILNLVNDFHGYTEIATLLVNRQLRGTAAGRLTSLSRFMYLARHMDRFSANVMAEIRGWAEKDKQPPFWEHVGAKFFHTSFQEADRQSAHDFRFISHLMPKFPIYVSLLPEEAREVIGKPHKTSARAQAMLEGEGFQWTQYVDIFDGGPSVECRLQDVRTVRQRSMRTLTISETKDHIGEAEPFLVCASAPHDFVCLIGHGHRQGGTVVVSPDAADLAGLTKGANVIASPMKG